MFRVRRARRIRKRLFHIGDEQWALVHQVSSLLTCSMLALWAVPAGMRMERNDMLQLQVFVQCACLLQRPHCYGLVCGRALTMIGGALWPIHVRHNVLTHTLMHCLCST